LGIEKVTAIAKGIREDIAAIKMNWKEENILGEKGNPI